MAWSSGAFIKMTWRCFVRPSSTNGYCLRKQSDIAGITYTEREVTTVGTGGTEKEEGRGQDPAAPAQPCNQSKHGSREGTMESALAHCINDPLPLVLSHPLKSHAPFFVSPNPTRLSLPPFPPSFNPTLPVSRRPVGKDYFYPSIFMWETASPSRIIAWGSFRGTLPIPTSSR